MFQPLDIRKYPQHEVNNKVYSRDLILCFESILKYLQFIMNILDTFTKQGVLLRNINFSFDIVFTIIHNNHNKGEKIRKFYEL